MDDHMALSRPGPGMSLDLAIAGWLDAKARRSGSARTYTTYREMLLQFRGGLQRAGLDLDSDPVAVQLAAQAFAGGSVTPGRQIARSTYNQRLAVLSSFYSYARKVMLLQHNPIDLVERGTVQAYAAARPLPADQVQACMKAIDRTTPAGARDYALLALYLQTGRRLSEVARLTWGDVQLLSSGKAVITFRAKGDKRKLDELPLPVTEALLSWLRMHFETDPRQLAADTPLFVSLAHNGSYGKQLGIQAIADICQKRLATSKVHATRHTWAASMVKAGASVVEIQHRLGHESLATTGRYLAELEQAENQYADTLANLLGIGS